MSDVYFTNFRSYGKVSVLTKLERLLQEAGLEKIDFKNKYVAIKIHFGEPGNLSYLRPNYSKVVADFIKKLGGRPFLSDCNTLYVGRRNNGLNHLEAAYENGYNPFVTGCHVIIADGIKGNDEKEVEINQKYIKKAKIGTAIVDSDIIISMNHFKGHESTGFGGALKNLGMGCGSRRGKSEMHSAGKPFVIKEKCKACKTCFKICNQDAISIGEDGLAYIDHNKCVGCGRCIAVCPFNAIKSANDESNEILNEKIAEYTYAVLKDKPHFHISFIVDVSPCCDCHAENDVAIVPNIGILASFDPVALDQACADLVNKAPAINLELRKEDNNHDHFKDLHPDTNWQIGLKHAEEIGIGSREYNLIEIK